MSWFVLALGAGLASALNVASSKLIVNRELRPVLIGGWVHLLGAALTAPALFFITPVVPWQAGILLGLLGMGLVYTLGNALYFLALAGVQLSEVDLFLRTSALWTFLGGTILLAEPASPRSALGAALVLGSVFLLARGAKLSFSRVQFSRVQWLALAAALVFGAGNVIDKALSAHFDPLSYTALNLALTGVGMLALGRLRVRDLRQPLLWQGGAWTVAATFAMTQLLIILAFGASGSAGGVILVAQIRLLLLMTTGILLLGEGDRLGRKAVAAALMIAGVFLLYGTR